MDVDSTWSTGVNNFIFDTNKFPNASAMVAAFHEKNIRVILWATSMIDTDSSNYAEGLSKGFFVSDGATIKWWHGEGSFLDYSNPDAVEWWHQQLDNVLVDVGVDGFKCDGTDPYIMEIIAYGKGGPFTERQYAAWYYGDFFNYSRSRNSNALIMSRPVDSFNSLIYLDFSPHFVMLSGWVGDQDPTFSGLKDALGNMFHSAWRNYTNFGSDIGGYRSGDRTKELFLRWAQLGAFCPLMENGGNGEHRPWMYDEETLQIYRSFVQIHYEIGPYLLSAGTQAYETHSSVMFPMAKDLWPLPVTVWAYQAVA